MIRLIFAAFVFVATLGANFSYAQQAVQFKNFVAFRQLVPGIDFFASNRQAVAPYEKPAAEVVARLKNLFKDDLPKGAIFICSKLSQKDAIYEPVVLKKGYGWTLTTVTSEVRMQETMERMKAQIAQMGSNIPEEIRQRLQNRTPDQQNRSPEMMANDEKRSVTTITQQIAYAVLQSMLGDDNFQFRSSRVDDMGKSPLPDWLDIGIASYASNNKSSLTFLQQNMEQTFSLEDVLSMSRPFVASSSDQRGGGRRGGDSGGGQGMPQMSGGGGFPGGGMPGGGFPGGGQGMPRMPGGGGAGRSGNGGTPNGTQRNMPKDEQDRMLFDGQSSTFFAYLMEKVGIEKVRELIQYVREDKEGRDFIVKPDVLGSDFEKIEADWTAWVKSLKQ